jgi:hypothetical protein
VFRWKRREILMTAITQRIAIKGFETGSLFTSPLEVRTLVGDRHTRFVKSDWRLATFTHSVPKAYPL